MKQLNSSPFDATKFGPDCPSNHIPTSEAYIGGPAGQHILTAEAQTGRPYSEDCLSLNVWTKPQSGEQSKAVLFWIFGGGELSTLIFLLVHFLSFSGSFCFSSFFSRLLPFPLCNSLRIGKEERVNECY